MASSKPPVRFQRATYVVSNLEEALKFYEGVLGFTIEFIKESDENSYSYTVFEIPKEAKMRFAVLSTEDAPRSMALVEAGGLALDTPPLPRRSAIVLDMADVDGVMEGARALGLKVYGEEKLITKDGRTGREIGIVDADDNLVVIYTITGRVDE